MENKLEQLLNSLIEKGWKPFGTETVQIVKNKLYLGYVNKTPIPLATKEWKYSWHIRELTSKESGLWQFVCENDLYPPYIQHRWFRDLPTNGLQIHDYRYWIIESSLKDESELEDFLLQNIKVDD